jgi:hypothetical protein
MRGRQSFLVILASAVLAGACADKSDKKEAPPAAAGVAAPAGDDAAPKAGAKNASRREPSPFSGTKFQPYAVVDRTQGGLVVGTIAVPEGWNAESNVQWTYSNVSFPVRMSARVSAPDGAAWLEWFPAELFYWLEPRDTSVAVGGRSLGMIHRPGIGVQEAMHRFVLGRYRGRAQNLQVLGYRPIGNLARALNQPPMEGDSIAARVRYSLGGRTVDEEFFAILTNVVRIPYTGPQGTTYEFHRTLAYVHSMGAADGKLDSLHPLLGFVAASWRPDPVWQRHSQQVYAQLAEQFNRNLAAGYARIAAAGRLSRAISANNDAMIQSIEAQRQATNRSQDRINDNFSQYIRGTERMQDPYYGTSEQSYTNKYHWTDGYGNYQHSNDPTFNPNNGSNASWQRMEPAKPH